MDSAVAGFRMRLPLGRTSIMRFLNILIAGVIAISIGACGSDRDLEIEERLKSEIKEKNKIIRTLRKEIGILQDKIKDQEVRIAELSVGQESGLAVEEKRKALAEKEARLNSLNEDLIEREARITELSAGHEIGLALEEKRKALTEKEVRLNSLEKSLEERQRSLDEEKDKFIASKREDFESIGRAQQMEKDYNNLKDELRASQHLANNWLKILFLALFLILCFIAYLIFLYIKNRRYREANENISSAIEFDGEDIVVRPEYKQLLIRSLGKALPPHQ